MNKKYYVTMSDKFMSGWGKAENKISKFVIECDNYTDALIARDRALTRSEMKYVNINYGKKPYYNPNRYHVSIVKFEDAPYFNKR
jgi:hypothetical protein